jgi:HNH endonuclease/AP2 domain
MDDIDIIRLPLKDKHGEVIAYTTIDKDDYDKIKDYTLCRSGSVKLYAYVKKEKLAIPLHHIILTKPEKGYVIDHINGDSLDNRKSNLQIASHSQNNQNREKKKGCVSRYIGVWKRNTKWVAECCNVKISTFDNEEDAATAYDTYAYIKFGPNARTNNLINYTECATMALDEFVSGFKSNNDLKLPEGISIEKEKYSVRVSYNGVFYRARMLKTLEEAQQQLVSFREVIEQEKQKEKQEIIERKILRNSKNTALIPITNKNKTVVAYALVSDEDYHDLLMCSWSLSNGYVAGRPQGKRKMSMHLYLFNKYNTDVHDAIDHINQNKLDNRRENLRGNSHSGNSHNAFKKQDGKTSQYKGVRFTKGRWRSEITKDKKYYYIGSFSTQKEAAIAYNNKAKELYGDFACLNVIPDPDIE